MKENKLTSEKEVLKFTISAKRKELNKLYKLQEKQENNGIYDDGTIKSIENIEEELTSLELTLDGMD